MSILLNLRMTFYFLVFLSVLFAFVIFVRRPSRGVKKRDLLVASVLSVEWNFTGPVAKLARYYAALLTRNKRICTNHGMHWFARDL